MSPSLCYMETLHLENKFQRYMYWMRENFPSCVSGHNCTAAILFAYHAWAGGPAPEEAACHSLSPEGHAPVHCLLPPKDSLGYPPEQLLMKLGILVVKLRSLLGHHIHIWMKGYMVFTTLHNRTDLFRHDCQHSNQTGSHLFSKNTELMLRSAKAFSAFRHDSQNAPSLWPSVSAPASNIPVLISNVTTRGGWP